MKIRGDMKKGTSIIILVLVIVITISVFMIIVTCLSNSGNMLEDSENEFKSSLVAYLDELDMYIDTEKKNGKFKENEFSVYGDELRKIIPYIKEEDMTRFAIFEGKIIYIGNDTLEEKWSKDVLNSKEK